MLKKMVFVTALGAALGPAPGFAADDARSSIHITANIPNKQFHVQPRDPEFGKDEVMHYNPVTRKLSPVRQIFDVKNTEGSVHAHLDGDSWLSNGSNQIVIGVRFNNVELFNSLSQEVVDDATSTPGTQAEMYIYAPFPTSRSQAGLYTGLVTVIFDAVPRVSL
ncbi:MULTISPECIES: CS1 type fimbrial major subunit [Pseudomonas]|uniref:CS1 type fimbrial major subunit n=1 Tax=Pseudomonas TaxID=286 RepID=UPI001E403542|nr:MULTISPECIES: CS1 type fimbrial major subunit [Pseudomonas]MCD9117380.1 fimbrial protein [Pseudomonas bijieensis]UQI30071.1 fimbrial protein [Pseudomonas bijieensis]WLH61821.1 CS1 type fimbrial major subunit [Pseudomonas sp. FP2300]